jgi:SAM-dependent methyltransferase
MVGEPWEIGQRETFQSRFGEDAEAYDRTRPVAPAAVFDELVRLAGLWPGASAVEIGPGTGQATRPLAERGLEIVALEIDERLAARAAKRLVDLPGVTVRAVSFEQWDPDGSQFDMVFACNSFHWVDPDVRFAKAAQLLEPAGALVVMSTPVVVPPEASRFWWDVQDDWEAVGAERLDPAVKHPDLVDDLVEPVRTCGLFDEPITRRYPFQLSVNAAGYVANLSTQSGFKQLPPPAQARLLERIGRRIESLGNQLTVHHLAVITIARRRASFT